MFILQGSTELTDTAKYKIKTTKQEDVNYISTLEVTNVTKEDYGRYVCKASNEKGTAAFSILLDVTSQSFFLFFFLFFLKVLYFSK